MSTTALDILVRAKDQASSTINGVRTAGTQLDTTLSNTTKTTGKLSSAFKSTAGKLALMAGGGLALRKAFSFGMDAIKSAEEAKAATKQAFASIKSDADGARISLGGLTTWAEDFGGAVAKDDEELKVLAGRLTQAIDLKKLFGEGGESKGLNMITEAVVNMSAATGKSESMLTKLFQSIANDPKAALTTLQKLGVITEADAARFTKMADSGKGAAVSQELLSKVSEKYQGQAAKGATATERLSTLWDNIKESLGEFLLPMFEKVVGWLQKMGEWFQSLSPAGKTFAVTIGAIVAAAVPILALGSKLTGAFTSVSTAIKSSTGALDMLKKVFMTNPLGFIITAVVGVATLIIANWDKVKKFMLGVWKAIEPVVGPIIKWIGNRVKDVVAFAKGIVGPIMKFIGDLIGKVKKAIDWLMELDKANKTAQAQSSSAAESLLELARKNPSQFPWVKQQLIAMLKDGTLTPAQLQEALGRLQKMPTLRSGGEVMRTGLAVVHEGEVFSGVAGRDRFLRGSSSAGGRFEITIKNWETGRALIEEVAAGQAEAQSRHDRVVDSRR